MMHHYGNRCHRWLILAALTLLAVGASAQTQIYTAEDLHNIRNNPGDDYILMNDIDLDHATLSALYGNVNGTQGNWYDEQKGWLPIGVPNEFNIYQIFFGTFDGSGHVIRNLYINRPGEYENNPPGQGGKVGLFGWTAGDPSVGFDVPPFGEIRNLGVEDADVTGAESVGILLGQNYGIIENCWSTGSVTAIGANPWGQPVGHNSVGGLIGVITQGAVADCYSTATVVAEGHAAGGFAGGIAGSSTGCTVDRCFATGDVTAFTSAGGFASGIQTATVRDCYSMGSVTATGERFGLSSVGGFVGYLSAGFFGDDDPPLRCYTISAVQGPGAEVEPFIGNIDEAFAMPVDCFYNSDINGLDNNGFGTPLTTAQMTYPYDAAAYTNYDFTTIWVEDTSGDNGGYPYHAWYTPTPPQPTATIVCNPQTLTLIDGANPGEMTVEYLGGNGPIYTYEIAVSWDPALATATASKPDSGPFSGAGSYFIVDDDTAGELLIAASLLGSVPGMESGDLFKLEFTGLAGGTSAVDLTVNAVADYQSPPTDPLPVAEDGQLDVDLTPPTIANVLITNTTLGSTEWVKDGDTIAVTATVTDNGTLASVTCDLTGFGGGAAVAPDGAPAGDVYTWTLASVTTAPADGPVSATVTAVDDLGNSASAADDITADNTAPQALTGLVAMPSHKFDGTDHYNQIILNWDDPTGLDDNFDRVEFRYVTEGGYPVYTTGAPGSPDLPAAPLATDALAFTETSSPFEWYLLPDGITPLPRDVYAVAAYVYDAAGNVSSISDVAYATSYYLGDIGPDVDLGDGLVGVLNDITPLANAYGTVTNDPGFNEHVDVGPTLDYTRFGIPAPDGVVGFQDLMIFAMNFGEVAPTAKSQGAMSTPVFAWNQVDERTWALELVYECAGLKGINVTGDLPDGVTVTVGGGQMMGEQEAQVFLRNIDRNGLDAGMAVMGNGEGFQGTGTLLMVTTSQPVADLQITVDARGLNNEDLLADLQQPTGVELPAQFELGQNFPNPFNPQTTIKFALPEAANVRLKIYGVNGRLVRTLVNENRSAGHHEVIWRGVDDASRPVATGTYFYVIDAGDHHEVRKMTLVK